MVQNVIVDFKRTIYDPDTDSLVEGVIEALKLLKHFGLHIRLVGKGTEEQILPLLERFRIKIFFDEILIEDDKEKHFNVAGDPALWLVIGDRARKEIKFGKERGMQTIWLKKGKFSQEEPEIGLQPDYFVNSWSEIIILLPNIVK